MGTANVVQDGGSAFASSAPITTVFFGCSTSANTIDLNIDPTNSFLNGTVVARYTYSAGAVTNTFSIQGLYNSGGAQNGTLQCVDTTNKVYYGGAQSTSSPALGRVRLNAGNTDYAESQGNIAPSLTDNGGVGSTAGSASLFISDDEALVYNTSSHSLTLYNPQLGLRARAQFAATTSSDSGFANHLVAAQPGWSSWWATALGFDLNASNRRLAVVSLFTTAGTWERGIRMQMFDLPRNYDQSIY